MPLAVGDSELSKLNWFNRSWLLLLRLFGVLGPLDGGRVGFRRTGL